MRKSLASRISWRFKIHLWKEVCSSEWTNTPAHRLIVLACWLVNWGTDLFTNQYCLLGSQVLNRYPYCYHVKNIRTWISSATKWIKAKFSEVWCWGNPSALISLVTFSPKFSGMSMPMTTTVQISFTGKHCHRRAENKRLTFPISGYTVKRGRINSR